MRAAAMDKPARTGKPQSSEPVHLFRLEGSEGRRADLVIFVPSYIHGKPTHTVTSAQDSQVRGFVVGVLRLARLINQALADFPHDEFRIAVYADASEFGTFSAQPTVFLGAIQEEGAPVPPRDRAAEIIHIAGRTLLIEFWPTASFLNRESSFYPSLVLVVSLTMTLIGASYVYFLRRQQEALAERELRLRMAMEGAALGIWDWHPHTGETSFNDLVIYHARL